MMTAQESATPNYMRNEHYMNGNSAVFVGNLTADPELRFTPGGKAVCNFKIASTARTYDRNAGEWVDENPVFMRCTAWGDIAENIAESFQMGNTVIAVGTLKQRTYETKEKVKVTSTELTVEEMGASVKFATVDIKKTVRRKSEPEPESEKQEEKETRFKTRSRR